jgi:hypothetical protein
MGIWQKAESFQIFIPYIHQNLELNLLRREYKFAYGK